jgi:hypothetical protein
MRTLFFYVASETDSFVTSVLPRIQWSESPCYFLLEWQYGVYGHVRRQDDNRIPLEVTLFRGLVLT